jgi:hypothetical protein
MLMLILFADVSDQHGHYKHHEPDPKNFFPVHLRREFVLENGQTTLLGTTNLTSVHDGDIVVYFENDEMKETRIVCELHGKEKSPAFQPPMAEG